MANWRGALQRWWWRPWQEFINAEAEYNLNTEPRYSKLEGARGVHTYVPLTEQEFLEFTHFPAPRTPAAFAPARYLVYKAGDGYKRTSTESLHSCTAVPRGQYLRGFNPGRRAHHDPDTERKLLKPQPNLAKDIPRDDGYVRA
jgi:hypothetical protein